MEAENRSVDLKPLIAHVTAMRDGIRTFLAERAALEIPKRSSLLVDLVFGGGLAGDEALHQQLAEARRMNATLAGEVTVLREEIQHYIDEGLLVPTDAPEGGA